ncbi:MAG: hypothetical protein EBU23_02605 [Mycobacteriaceae bacterium]|nr:hypothetical protein [Mycobacteriaceae bacterium]
MALENLYGLFRSLMIPGVIVAGVAVNGAKVTEYLVTGKGELPEFGLAAVYTGFAAVVGFLVVANRVETANRAGPDESRVHPASDPRSATPGLSRLASAQIRPVRLSDCRYGCA